MKSNNNSSNGPKFLPKDLSLEEYCEKIIEFVKLHDEKMFQYDFDKDEYVNQFLVKNHFESRVPKSWANPLLNLTFEELINFAKSDRFLSSDKNNNNYNFPESLVKFKRFCDGYQLQKIESSERIEIDKKLKLQCSKKKVHELERLMKIVQDYVVKNDIKVIFDLGCGKGYLTSLIGVYFPKVEIIGIDNSSDQIEKFRRRKENLVKVNYKKKLELSNVKLFIKNLTLENLQELDKYLEKGNALILALHACGDLTPFCMKIYTCSEKIVGLINVSCCYFKLSNGNFPISKFFAKRIKNYDTRNLAIACFATKTWTMKNSIPQFMFRSYRFAFEALLYDRDVKKGRMSKFNGRKVPKRTKKFAQYCKWSFGRLKENYPTMRKEFQKVLDEKNFDENVERFYQKFLPDENNVIKSVACFWCLRGLFSPLIETQVVLDRYMFLKEQENVETVELKKIFQSSISPRNTLLLSSKKKKKNKCID